MTQAVKFQNTVDQRHSAAPETDFSEGALVIRQYARLAGVPAAQALEYVKHGRPFPDRRQQQAFCEAMMLRGASVETLRFNHPELRALKGSQLLH